MKRIFGLSISLMLSVLTMAQTQQGYVKTKGRWINGSVVKGTRLSGATVAVRGRNTVVSGNNGAFSLVVPGNSYYLQNVQKQGYVLNDPEILSRQYTLSKNPLVLVMETPDEQLEDKLEAMAKIRATLQDLLLKSRAKIKALKEQNKITQEEYQKKLQELSTQQETNEKLISDMADRYSKMDFDEVDEFNRRISLLILDGKLTEADSLLNTKGDINSRAAVLRQHQEANEQAEQELKKKQKKLEKAKAMTQKELEDLAQDCYRKFEIFNMQHQIDSAVYYIEMRASLDTLNIDWALDVGKYLNLFVADYNKSLAVYESALNRALAQTGEKSLNAILLYNNIANVYNTLGRYDEAISLYLKTIALEEEVYGEKHPTIATSYNNLGLVYSETERNEEAQKCYEKSLACSLGEPRDSVRYLINMAALYIHLGNYDAAKDFYEKVLEIASREDDIAKSEVAISYNGLALCYSKKDEYQKAIEYYEKALELNRQVFGDKHPDIALNYNNIGAVYNKIGKYDKAIACFTDALDINTQVYGTWHPVVAVTYGNIGYSLNHLGKYEETMEYYKKALDIDRQFYGNNHIRVGTDLVNIGSLYMELKDYPHSLDYYFEALEIFKAVVGEKHPKVGTCYNNIGSVYNETGEYGKAIEYLEKALEVDLAIYGEDNANIAATYNNLGNSYNKLGDYAKAAMYLEKCLPILIRAYGEEHTNVAMTYYNTGVLHKKQGNYKKALELSEKAYSIISKILPEDHPILKTMSDGIDEIKSKLP